MLRSILRLRFPRQIRHGTREYIEVPRQQRRKERHIKLDARGAKAIERVQRPHFYGKLLHRFDRMLIGDLLCQSHPAEELAVDVNEAVHRLVGSGPMLRWDIGELVAH